MRTPPRAEEGVGERRGCGDRSVGWRAHGFALASVVVLHLPQLGVRDGGYSHARVRASASGLLFSLLFIGGR